MHPKQKRPVGERLARLALFQTYHRHNIVPSGPLYQGVKFHDGRAIVSFRYAEGLHTSDGAPVSGFEVAGSDHLFHAAQTVITGETVIVWSDKVVSPAFVRYAWQPYTTANLVNIADIPASTFTSEMNR